MANVTDYSGSPGTVKQYATFDEWLWGVYNIDPRKLSMGDKEKYYTEYNAYKNIENPEPINAKVRTLEDEAKDNAAQFVQWAKDTYGARYASTLSGVFKPGGVIDYNALSQNQIFLNWLSGGNSTLATNTGTTTTASTGSVLDTSKPLTTIGATPVTPATTSEIPAALQGLTGIKKMGKYWVWDDIVNGKLKRYTFDENGEIFNEETLGDYVGGGSQLGSVSDLDRLAFDREQFDWQRSEADKARQADAAYRAQQVWESERDRQEQAAYRKQQAELEKEKLLASLSGPRSWIQYWQAKYGTLPNTPQFVANYTGQQAGSQIKATNVVTPSGQWLNQAAPSVREGLMGFADWSASSNASMTGEDLLNSTKQQLPTDAPYGSNRWLPMRK